MRVGFAVQRMIFLTCALSNPIPNRELIRAVRVGFEPTVTKYRYKGFQDLRHRPLGHLTMSGEGGIRTLGNLAVTYDFQSYRLNRSRTSPNRIKKLIIPVFVASLNPARLSLYPTLFSLKNSITFSLLYHTTTTQRFQFRNPVPPVSHWSIPLNKR